MIAASLVASAQPYGQSRDAGGWNSPGRQGSSGDRGYDRSNGWGDGGNRGGDRAGGYDRSCGGGRGYGRGYSREDGDGGGAVAEGLVGLFLGAAVANSGHQDYGNSRWYSPPYGSDYYGL